MDVLAGLLAAKAEQEDSLSEATQAALRDKALSTLTTLRLSAEPVLSWR